MSGSRRRQALMAGLIAAALTALPMARAAGPETDPAGDTRDADKEPVDSPASDIVGMTVDNMETDFVFRYTVTKPVDPLTDPGWPSSDSFSDFWIDTTGDSEPDYDAEYGVDEGKLYVIVVSASDEDAQLCEGKAAYENEQYVASVPKVCLGSPTVLNYRLDTSYRANAADQASPVAYDTAPDSGMTSAPAAAPESSSSASTRALSS